MCQRRASFSTAPAVGRVPGPTYELSDLRFSVVEPRCVSGGGPQAVASLRLVELPRPRLLGTDLALQRLASAIMQKVAAPPRTRIGGLCLPLNSRKPPRRLPAGETRGGTHGGSGAGSGPRRAQFLGQGNGEGGWTAPMGPDPRDCAALGLSHVEMPRTREGERSRLSELEGTLYRLSIRSASKPRQLRGSVVSTLWPQSPPPHNGGVGIFSLSPAGAGRREGRGPEGIRGWSLAGPRTVFGLEVWPGSCGDWGGGTSLPWDLCEVRSPGNYP